MLEVKTSLSRQDEHILFVSCALGLTMGVCSLVCVGVMARFISNIRLEHVYCIVLLDISTVKWCACLQREAATWTSDQPTEKLHRWHRPSRDCGPAASWTRQHERLHHATHTVETAVLKAAPGHSLSAAQGHSPFSFHEQSPSWCWEKRSRKIVTDESWVSWALARQRENWTCLVTQPNLTEVSGSKEVGFFAETHFNGFSPWWAFFFFFFLNLDFWTICYYTERWTFFLMRHNSGGSAVERKTPF